MSFISGALSQEQKECAQIQHSITSHQNDMIKLNTLIAEKRGLQERLEEKNVIAENDFTHVLKVLIGSLLQFVRYLLHSIPGR